MNKRRRTEYGSTPYQTVDDSSKPRLTRACAQCKKQKVKCEVQPGQASCLKCLRSDIECTPYNFAQKFIDEDATWKTRMTAELEQLKATVEYLCRNNNLQSLSNKGTDQHLLESVPALTNVSNDVSPTNFLSEGPLANVDKDDTELIPVPMNNLYSLTDPHNSHLIRVDPIGVNGPDFISKGVVTVNEAEHLFDYFHNHINPLLWNGLLCPHRTLKDARRASTLLVATVLTVAALQIPGRENTLHAIYDAFVALMRGSCLLRSQSLDDIRGLCIGAFYLTSLSWALCSRAVRVATEMNLHKCSLQLSLGSLESHERVRLWYALYVCDHQFALAYGRPPMMHEDAAVRNLSTFLSSRYTTSGDIRLAAQVNLFRILAEVYFMYGCDPDLELDDKDFHKLRSFNVSIEQWRVAYSLEPAETPKHSLDPVKETALYYHLSRFQVNSLALRGISARNATEKASYAGLSFDRRELANIAIAAATGTLKLLVEETDLCRALIGMPIFAHAMIAVCSSFLLKMQVAFGSPGGRQRANTQDIIVPKDLARLGLSFQSEDALSLVQNLAQALNAVADSASYQHVARHVVTGLRELLGRFSKPNQSDQVVYSRVGCNAEKSGSTGDADGAQMTVGNNLAFSQNSIGDFGSTTVPVGTNMNRSSVTADSSVSQDPFDFMGDLDWRFNDGFLWQVDGMDTYY